MATWHGTIAGVLSEEASELSLLSAKFKAGDLSAAETRNKLATIQAVLAGNKHGWYVADEERLTIGTTDEDLAEALALAERATWVSCFARVSGFEPPTTKGEQQ